MGFGVGFGSTSAFLAGRPWRPLLRVKRPKRREQQAETTWRPFLDWLVGSPQEFSILSAPWIVAVPARRFGTPDLKGIPGVVLADDRPGAPEANVFWAGNLEEAGQVLHGYQSAWLPRRSYSRTGRSLGRRAVCGEPALGRVAARQQGPCGRACRRDRRRQGHGDDPAVLDAFVLVISGAEGPPAIPAFPVTSPI